jgi:hypothetical protein
MHATSSNLFQFPKKIFFNCSLQERPGTTLALLNCNAPKKIESGFCLCFSTSNKMASSIVSMPSSYVPKPWYHPVSRYGRNRRPSPMAKIVAAAWYFEEDMVPGYAVYHPLAHFMNANFDAADGFDASDDDHVWSFQGKRSQLHCSR